MAFTYFTALLKAQAVVSDGADEGNEPDTQDISALVTFTPTIREAQIDVGGVLTTVRLEPIIGRLEETGILCTIDGTTGVKLLCGDDTEGDPLYGLAYTVTFDKVVYNKQRGQRIEPFRFVAPTTAETVNLASVERVPF